MLINSVTFLSLNPVAFSVGPLHVRWYGILIASAMLIAALGGCRKMRKAGINEDDFLTIFMITITIAIIGARAYYVLFEWPYYMQHPNEIIAIWHGGLAVHGGLLVGILSIYIGCRWYHISFWKFVDLMAPFMVLGQAIGRWGNFFNQEAYGYEVDPTVVPWAMWIDGAYRHPTFLYESCWDLLVFFVLLWLGKKAWVKRGEIALSYLMLYSIGRVIVEGFRTDSLMLGPLRMAQVMSLILFFAAAFILLYRRKKSFEEQRKKES